MENQEMNFKLDTDDLNGMIALMDELGTDTDDVVYPDVNQVGDTIHISIFPNKISIRVFQENGWIRRSVYHRDGTSEEIYEGRWAQ